MEKLLIAFALLLVAGSAFAATTTTATTIATPTVAVTTPSITIPSSAITPALAASGSITVAISRNKSGGLYCVVTIDPTLPASNTSYVQSQLDICKAASWLIPGLIQ